MEFELNGKNLIFEDEENILIYRNSGNWKNNPKWYKLTIWIDNRGYKKCSINRKDFSVHRIIAYLFLGLNIEDTKQCIDHIDGNKQNNKIENLRIVTNQQNHFNETKAKGYSWNINDKKFQANIGLNGKTIYLGQYNTEEEARQAYLDAKKIYHVIP